MLGNVAYPLWLTLPVIPLLMLLMLPGSGLLPGSWSQQIDPALASFVTKSVTTQKRNYSAWLLTGLWTMLAACLATISFGYSASPSVRNPHARVVVIDLGSAQTSTNVNNARRFIDSTTDTPTGVVAVTSQAFNVVPITTDHSHIERYLQVLSVDLMPVHGHTPQRGIENARQMLRSSNTPAPQIVLFTAGTAPAAAALDSAVSHRRSPPVWFVVDTDVTDQWQFYASQTRARVIALSQLNEVTNELETSRRRAEQDSVPVRERRELTPWLIGVSILLWLLLYFRRPAS